MDTKLSTSWTLSDKTSTDVRGTRVEKGRLVRRGRRPAPDPSLPVREPQAQPKPEAPSHRHNFTNLPTSLSDLLLVRLILSSPSLSPPTPPLLYLSQPLLSPLLPSLSMSRTFRVDDLHRFPVVLTDSERYYLTRAATTL